MIATCQKSCTINEIVFVAGIDYIFQVVHLKKENVLTYPDENGDLRLIPLDKFKNNFKPWNP